MLQGLILGPLLYKYIVAIEIPGLQVAQKFAAILFLVCIVGERL